MFFRVHVRVLTDESPEQVDVTSPNTEHVTVDEIESPVKQEEPHPQNEHVGAADDNMQLPIQQQKSHPQEEHAEDVQLSFATEVGNICTY